MMSIEGRMYYMMRNIKSLGCFFFFFNLARLGAILLSINSLEETPRKKRAI